MKERIPEHLREEAMRSEYANLIGTKPRLDLEAMQTRKNGAPWCATLLDTAGSSIDMASFHFYSAPDYELPRMTESISRIRKLCREKVRGKTIPLIATQSADDRGITLYLNNRTGRSHETLDLAFPGLRPGRFEAKLLSASDPTSNDTTLVTIPCEATSEGCRLKLPAWSMAVVRCSIWKSS